MTEPIRLHDHIEDLDVPLRLHVFPGRAMGEREFDRRQEYTDARLARLLAAATPGIREGFEVSMTGGPTTRRIRVGAGLGVGATGAAVRLDEPMDASWDDLVEESVSEATLDLRNGIHFLVIQRNVQNYDVDADHDPCRRTEPDPLRDRRIETAASLRLHFVTDEADFFADDISQIRAVNRLSQRFLDGRAFRAIGDEAPLGGGVPIGLVKVVLGAPVWLERVGGRFAAERHAEFRTFLAHTVRALRHVERNAPPVADDPMARLAARNRHLSKLLDLDALPAAGPFPESLLYDIGGDSPKLLFDARDLQAEMTAVPASAVRAVIDRELPRGSVDLVLGLGDRIRLLVAVVDDDWSPELLDHPQVDLELEKEYVERSETFFEAHHAWIRQWHTLYAGLDEATRKAVSAPGLVNDEAKYLSGMTPRQALDDLVGRKRAESGADDPPRPYSDWAEEPRIEPIVPQPVVAEGDGLFAERAEVLAQIRALEEELAENRSLIGEVNDHMSLQRQQFDVVSVAFTALANGTPGDGSGNKIAKWAIGSQALPVALQRREEERP